MKNKMDKTLQDLNITVNMHIQVIVEIYIFFRHNAL